MQKEMQIILDPKDWEGIYSNMLLITNSQTEFILDFARVMPGNNQAKVFSRIITNPTTFKMFAQQMQNVLKMFEEKFGEIPIINQEGKEKIGF